MVPDQKKVTSSAPPKVVSRVTNPLPPRRAHVVRVGMRVVPISAAPGSDWARPWRSHAHRQIDEQSPGIENSSKVPASTTRTAEITLRALQ